MTTPFKAGAIVAVIAAIAACSERSEQSTSVPAQATPVSTLDRVLEKGMLRVGYPGDVRPMAYRNPDTNEYEGFFVDAVNDFAASAGAEVEWVVTSWGEMMTGLASDRFDIVLWGSFNMGRARQGAYPEPVATTGTVPMTLAENVDRFTSWDSINQADVTVAVTLGTVFEEEARAFFPNAEVVAVQAPSREYQEVLSGRADVSITSSIDAAGLSAQQPELVAVAVDPRNEKPLGMILPRDDAAFVNYVNTWITMQTYAGYFDALAEKWGLPTRG